MYNYISGTLVHKEATHVVLETGGIGYEIKISLHTYGLLKSLDRCKLYTFFHVKEDAQTLYGFCEQEEKVLFTHLISVSGVGPSTAMVVLSYLNADELKSAILTDNVRLIQSVKGIGAKTAQRLVLELKDKVAKLPAPSGLEAGKPAVLVNRLEAEAIEALVALGIPKATAEKNTALVVKQFGAALTLEELIKRSLKN
jgi:Holliday junction DNA helicase RuvA